jgi:hypothetical protein
MFEKCAIVVMVVCIIAVGWLVYVGPKENAATFNKFKSESQPTATYRDAFFTKLTIRAGDKD